MQLNNKERNYLRKLAHNIEPIIRIGKMGLNDAVIDSVAKAIAKQEIIKVKILSNSDEVLTRELEEKIEKEANCTAVYAIGHTMIFFKFNKKGKITKEFMEYRKSQKNV